MAPVRSVPRAWWWSVGGLTVALLAHLAIGGSFGSDLPAMLKAIAEGPNGTGDWSALVWQIRLPRALACVLAGAILGSAGCAFQLLFRNPLAEPYVVGVSGGAAVAGTVALSLGLAGLALEIGVVAAAAAGGFLALALVLRLARSRWGARSEGVLIAGVVVGTLLMSLMTVVLLLGGRNSSDILRWMLGSVTPMFWSRVGLLLLAFTLGYWILRRESRALNAMALGETHARSVGVDPERSRNKVLLAGALMSGVAVGATGMIGFLGMIAPNAARLLAGPDSRVSLPLSAVLGAALLLFADLLAQRMSQGIELPVGAVTALLGAPALLWLLGRRV